MVAAKYLEDTIFAFLAPCPQSSLIQTAQYKHLNSDTNGANACDRIEIWPPAPLINRNGKEQLETTDLLTTR